MTMYTDLSKNITPVILTKTFVKILNSMLIVLSGVSRLSLGLVVLVLFRQEKHKSPRRYGQEISQSNYNNNSSTALM